MLPLGCSCCSCCPSWSRRPGRLPLLLSCKSSLPCLYFWKCSCLSRNSSFRPQSLCCSGMRVCQKVLLRANGREDKYALSKNKSCAIRFLEGHQTSLCKNGYHPKAPESRGATRNTSGGNLSVTVLPNQVQCPPGDSQLFLCVCLPLLGSSASVRKFCKLPRHPFFLFIVSAVSPCLQ